MRAPRTRPPSNSTFRNLPNRLELSLRSVLALPNASRNGLQSITRFSMDTPGTMPAAASSAADAALRAALAAAARAADAAPAADAA